MAETLRKGDLAEIAVIKDLMLKGYKVCIPYGSDWRFDLVVFNGNVFKRIQVKTCLFDSRKRNRIIVRGSSRNPFNGNTHKYSTEEVDYIAAYHPGSDYVFYIPMKEFEGKHALSFRESIEGHTAHNKSQMKVVKDYMELII